MAKMGALSLKQEAAASSRFHAAMLTELERHHEEKGFDWSTKDPRLVIWDALDQLDSFTSISQDPKRLVHAANFLMIAWSILDAKVKP